MRSLSGFRAGSTRSLSVPEICVEHHNLVRASPSVTKTTEIRRGSAMPKLAEPSNTSATRQPGRNTMRCSSSDIGYRTPTGDAREGSRLSYVRAVPLQQSPCAPHAAGANVRQYFGPAPRADFGSIALASLRLTSGGFRREHAGPPERALARRRTRAPRASGGLRSRGPREPVRRCREPPP